MTVEIGTEAAQFPDKEYINGIFVAVYCWASLFCYMSKYLVDLYKVHNGSGWRNWRGWGGGGGCNFLKHLLGPVGDIPGHADHGVAIVAEDVENGDSLLLGLEPGIYTGINVYSLHDCSLSQLVLALVMYTLLLGGLSMGYFFIHSKPVS
jgi:hypothetical protein